MNVPAGTLGARSVWRALMVAALVLSLCFGPATATAVDDAAQARTHYDAARRSYDIGRFDQAIEAFTRAYQLDPAPILLFNIGQAHWKKGDSEQALLFYRRYLEADPAADNRQRVEDRIRELEARPAKVPPLAAPAPPAVAMAGPPVTLTAEPPEAPPPLHRRPWFWGAAVGLLGAATLVTVLSLRSGEPWTCGRDCPTIQVE